SSIHIRLCVFGLFTVYHAVTPTVDLYPCHQFVGNKEFVIGNVYEGVKNNELVNKFKTCNCYSKSECRDCWANMYCSGGCAANNYNATGNLNHTHEYSCKLFRKRIEMALAVKIYEFIKEAEKEELEA